MRSKTIYVAPNLEEVCDAPKELLCVSPYDQYTSPTFGGQEDDFIF